MDAETIQAMNAMRAELIEAVQASVTSAHSSARTVDDPRQAAEYVVNRLTAYDTDLLRRAADVFAPPVPQRDSKGEKK